METDKLESLFEGLNFDVEEPKKDHEQRFLKKLKQQGGKNTSHRGVFSLWIPLISVAAAIVLVLTVYNLTVPPNQKYDLAAVSPEMEQTQNFYTSAIRKELHQLKEQRSPETEAVINDALDQLDILEKDYLLLEKDLLHSGQDNRVIYAMISNFQKRIDLLNLVIKKVKAINNLKTKPHENNIM